MKEERRNWGDGEMTWSKSDPEVGTRAMFSSKGGTEVTKNSPCNTTPKRRAQMGYRFPSNKVQAILEPKGKEGPL